MTLLSALFAAISLAAASASLHHGLPYSAALWAFAGGWWGSRTLREALGWLYDRSAARREP